MSNSISLFSPSINCIPCANHVDGNRVQMSKQFHQQYLPIVDPIETPLLRTPALNDITSNSSFFIKRASKEGVVYNIHNKMIVEYEDSIDIFDKYPYFDIKVENRSKVNANDVIMQHKSVTNKGLAYGVHLNTIAGMLKYTYEDSIAFTESGAKMMTSMHYEIEDYMITKNIFELNTQLLESGEIQKGDWIIKGYKKMSNMLSSPKPVVYAEKSYSIHAIEVQMFEPKYFVSNNTQQFIDKYSVDNEINDITAVIENKELSEKVKTSYSSHFHKDNGIVGIIRVIYKFEKQLEVGDKVVNRYGNKGVVSKIIPDQEAINDIKHHYGENAIPNDYVPHMFYNPMGIHTRMNPMQLVESALLYIQKYSIPKRLKAMLKEGKSPKECLIWILENVHKHINNHYYEAVLDKVMALNSEHMKILLDNVINTGLEIEVNTIEETMDEKCMQILLNVDKKYYESIGNKNINGMQMTLGYGVMYMLKLEHQVYKKVNAVSTSKYSTKYNSPVDGQKVGEMETWAVAAYDAPNTLYSIQKPKSDEHISKKKMYETIVREGKVSIQDIKETQSTSLTLVKGLLAVVDADIIDLGKDSQNLLNPVIDEEEESKIKEKLGLNDKEKA